NAGKIFNEKAVDELIFLDIDGTRDKKEPPSVLVKDIATECVMPFCYGGGVKRVDQIRMLLASGTEKVGINCEACNNPDFIKEAAQVFGSSTIVISIDYKKNLFGKTFVYVNGGRKNTKIDPVSYAKKMEELGAGELLVNAIDKDGTMSGYDIEM